MKKVILLFATVFVAFASFAQSEAGSFGVEINFNPFGAGESPVFSTDGLKVRYFVSDNMAIRGTLSLSTITDEEGSYESDAFVTDKTTFSTFGIAPGFEYHVTKFDKGSVYVGAEIGAAFGNQKRSIHTDASGVEDFNRTDKVFGLGAGVFTGVDYFITQKLYIGAELGLNYSSVKFTPENTTPDTKDSYTKDSALGFTTTPTFRLGWTF